MFGSGFSGGFGNWYNNLRSNPAANSITLGSIGAAGYGYDDENARRAAYSALLGKGMTSPFSAQSTWLARNEGRFNRLLDSLQLDNPGLRMPDYLAGLDLGSLWRAASPDETGRQPRWVRTRYNTL